MTAPHFLALKTHVTHPSLPSWSGIGTRFTEMMDAKCHRVSRSLPGCDGVPVAKGILELGVWGYGPAPVLALALRENLGTRGVGWGPLQDHKGPKDLGVRGVGCRGAVGSPPLPGSRRLLT